MPIPWHTSAKAFTRVLRRYGLDPVAVADVDAAWRAFAEFAQVELAGLAPDGPDNDMLIAQWGSYEWRGNRPFLTFARQLTVPHVPDSLDEDEDEPSDDVDLWQLELIIGLSDTLTPAEGRTDWHTAPPGPARAAALAAMAAEMRRHEPLDLAWRTVPATVELAFAHVC